MSDDLIRDLQSEIELGRHLGRQALPYLRLESLIRKYSIQTPGDVHDQPGQWQIRGGNVDAIQHDGTEISANRVRDWVIDRGGNIVRRFTDYGEGGDDADTFLRIDSPRQPDVIGPGWWVVKTADGLFFAVSNSDFHIIYVPRRGDETHAENL